MPFTSCINRDRFDGAQTQARLQAWVAYICLDVCTIHEGKVYGFSDVGRCQHLHHT